MSNATTYRVKLFASLKEHAGREEWVHETDSALTARELLHAFFEQYPALDKLRGVTRIAVDRAFCEEESPLNPGDELAFIPPVSGG
uniref:Molybdopterin synthase sulfur carrier subunit n=1 Tax=Candidatus Kentrum sp. FW TaxID=2126338 RepID=A0A450SVA0_9GAMM|nr:MAG: molybdopterin synthase catalytic subunit/molybdopterin synthase sulfur carrier subunit [Candidatus Kentron sp. FW]VFJ57943.1 MAG: molybdopterin synthase catalytic subunit/molybdopterin synthase sulfur carrier subunit [Candidatus Kentron sp. FW]